MAKALHILTHADDGLSPLVLAQLSLPCAASPSATASGSDAPPTEPPHLRVIDLTQPGPDYRALLEAIFDADTVAVW